MGFFNIIIDANDMAWYDALNASIESNETTIEETLPTTTVIEELWCSEQEISVPTNEGK